MSTNQKVRKTRTTTKSTKKITNKRKNTRSTSFLGKEVKGLVYILVAILGILHIVGYELGYGGEFIGYFFGYTFGIGAILPTIFLAYAGLRTIFSEAGISLTLRGFLWFFLFSCLLGLVSLFSVPMGAELNTQYFLNYGGIVGGLLAFCLHQLAGEVGAIVMAIGFVVALLLAVTKLSLQSGFKKVKKTASPVTSLAKETADYGVQVVKEKAVERMDAARHRVEVWHDTKMAAIASSKKALEEKRKQRKIFDIEKYGEGPGIRNTAMEDLPFDENRSVIEEPVDRVVSLEEKEGTMPTPMAEAFAVEEESVLETPILEVEVVAKEAPMEVEEVVEEPAIEPTVTVEEHAIDPAPVISEESRTVPTALPPAFEGTDADTAAVSVSQEDTPRRRHLGGPYHFPPMSMLKKGSDSIEMAPEVAQNAALLESTLESFGIKARIINATQGPAVTRYELEPAPGVKVSKIVNLTDDIALNLAAAGIRMEAPIPGKAAIGIEIPNKSISPVFLRDVLDNDEFKQANGGVPVGLGKDIAGKPIITDLSKMPHLLVAGSTGSGKSVCINTLIASILFSRKPEDVKLILIDPKMVELSNYNGVPHLMVPVVTDMKKAAAVLKWAVKEMESRYRSFAESNVRDIKRYNEVHPETAMPLVVLIIDELADLMMVAPADIEDSIARLAQMARAAGIHLVLATQRPSVDVITGTIKANVPSRISFAVSSQIDSRTILDMAGAEKLLGKGDMLFNPIGASKPIRIQGAFISDAEVEALVEFIKKQGAPKYDDSILSVQEDSTANTEDGFFEDELLEKAIDLVFETGQASASMLQRRFRIGYTRAARLIDMLEQMNIVGPSMGSKPRELLMSRTQVQDKYFSN